LSTQIADVENERKVNMFRSVNEFDQPVWIVEIEWIEEYTVEQRYFEISNKIRAERVFKLLSSGTTYAALHLKWRNGAEPFNREPDQN
jgi:hypothetical protein